MKIDNRKIAYVVLETEKDEDGFIPCIVKEGVKGYFRTDWSWGNDLTLARQCADEKNQRMGLTPEVVNKLIVSSF